MSSGFGNSLVSSYLGVATDELAKTLNVPQVLVYSEVTSTMDVAQQIAVSGAEAGTVVVALAQTSGRGRGGKSWSSESGSGIWLTVIERPTDRAILDVLSLRVGLSIASNLDPLNSSSQPWSVNSLGSAELTPTILLKWPNDLIVGAAKLGGILIEVRWRDQEIESVAIGVGINLRLPSAHSGFSVHSGSDATKPVGLLDLDLHPQYTASPVEVFYRIVNAIRAACSVPGNLSPEELEQYDLRDSARGRKCSSPLPGVVTGINRAGELLIQTSSGLKEARSGSLVYLPTTIE